MNLRSILPRASREKNGVKIFKFRPTLFLVNPGFDQPGFEPSKNQPGNNRCSLFPEIPLLVQGLVFCSRIGVCIQDLVFLFKDWRLYSRFSVFVQGLVFCSRIGVYIQDLVFLFKDWCFVQELAPIFKM